MNSVAPRTRAVDHLRAAVELLEDARRDIPPRSGRGRWAVRQLGVLADGLLGVIENPDVDGAAAVERIRLGLGAVRRNAPPNASDSLAAANTTLLCAVSALEQSQQWGSDS